MSALTAAIAVTAVIAVMGAIAVTAVTARHGCAEYVGRRAPAVRFITSGDPCPNPGRALLLHLCCI
ncbi:hypothetical protein ACFU76_07110 [Streptomyces sp. NPDC057539]|uniref:hypothetical protein n=1 Tax=Streptomyces sp. NPDC057539 TaxID=3346159 RepID=UPI0036906A6B